MQQGRLYLLGWEGGALASLIEELITVLKAEEAVYRELLPVVEQKTQIIVRKKKVPAATPHNGIDP